MHRTSTMRLLAAAVGTLALATPAAATFAAVTGDCAFRTLAEPTVTGQAFTGIAYGYAVSDTPGSSVSVTCEVRVNGGSVASTPAGSSGQASTTAGQVTYGADETDTVQLCAVWTGSESGEVCGEAVTQQFPPQEVNDLFAALVAPPVTLNQGDTGLVLQSVVEFVEAAVSHGTGKSSVPSVRAPKEVHDVVSQCSYKYMRHAGVIHVQGKTKAGRHPVATSATIRCQIPGLFDRSRTEPGTTATIDDVVFAPPGNYTVCNGGSGTWDDGDGASTAWTCA